MIGIVELVMLSLATFRISHMVAEEDGPADVCRIIKQWAGATWSHEAGCWVATGFVGRLITCPLCLSVWVAAFVYTLVALAPVAWPLVAVAAISGASCAIELGRGR